MPLSGEKPESRMMDEKLKAPVQLNISCRCGIGAFYGNLTKRSFVECNALRHGEGNLVIGHIFEGA